MEKCNAAKNVTLNFVSVKEIVCVRLKTLKKKKQDLGET